MATRTKRAGEERLIKKYPNRRLYDTQTSTYVTLVDIKGLVMAITKPLISTKVTYVLVCVS